jgi:hypothetical protein
MFTAKFFSIALLLLGPVAFAAIPLGAGGLMKQNPPIPTPPMAVPTIEIAPAGQSGSSVLSSEWKAVVRRPLFVMTRASPFSGRKIYASLRSGRRAALLKCCERLFLLRVVQND